VLWLRFFYLQAKELDCNSSQQSRGVLMGLFTKVKEGTGYTALEENTNGNQSRETKPWGLVALEPCLCEDTHIRWLSAESLSCLHISIHSQMPRDGVSCWPRQIEHLSPWINSQCSGYKENVKGKTISTGPLRKSLSSDNDLGFIITGEHITGIWIHVAISRTLFFLAFCFFRLIISTFY
jgi:hypothetical protein